MHVWLILMNVTWIKHVYSIFQTYLGWQCQLTKIYFWHRAKPQTRFRISCQDSLLGMVMLCSVHFPCCLWAWVAKLGTSWNDAWERLVLQVSGTVAVRKEWTDVNRFSWWYLNMFECIWHIWCAGQAWSGMKVWSDQHKHYQTLASAYDLDRLYIVSAWFLQCCFCVEL